MCLVGVSLSKESEFQKSLTSRIVYVESKERHLTPGPVIRFDHRVNSDFSWDRLSPEKKK